MQIAETGILKNKIVRTKDLLNNNEPVKLDEDVCEAISCYAYSLGIIYDGSKRIRFNPGFTENLIYSGRSSSELLQKVCVDLKNLNIPFRQIDLKGEKELKKNEYLVKVFYAKPSEHLLFGDYHFIRQNPKNKQWFHKPGIKNQPELLKMDYGYGNVVFGEEPDIITSLAEEGFFYDLRPVGYFAITECKAKKNKFL